MQKRLIFISLLLALSFYESNAFSDEMPEQDKRSEEILDIVDFTEVDIRDVLKVIAQRSGRNITSSMEVKGRVNIYLRNVSAKDALEKICKMNNMALVEKDGTWEIITAPEFERLYGYPYGAERETRVYRLANAKVADVLPLLEKFKSSAGNIIADETSGILRISDIPMVLEDMEHCIELFDVPFETEVFPLNFTRAEEIEPKLRGILTPQLGKIIVDERANQLIIADIARNMPLIKKIIKVFDIKEQEVLIEAKIVQIALDESNKMGIDWEAVLNKARDFKIRSQFDILGTTDKRGRITVGKLDDDNFSLLVEALGTIGKTNILSSPRITVINNKEAKILVGSTEPYVTSSLTTTAAGPVTTAESVNFIEVGVKLYVTPTIHKDGFITIKIKPEVSSVTGDIATSSNNIIPVIETSEVETTVMVKDGVTLVIGGLIKEETIDQVKKVPVLGSVPVLGFLFRNQSKTLNKTEIVIFLTPRIISGEIDLI